MSKHSKWKSISKTVAQLENSLLASVLLMMILLAVLQILLRNLFDTSLFWIDPFNRLMVLWLAILGSMVATREREHISIDIVQHYISGRISRIIAAIGNLFASLICLCMAYHSGRFVYYEYVDGMQTFSGLPAWPFELILPFGMTVMSIRFLLSLTRSAPKASE